MYRIMPLAQGELKVPPPSLASRVVCLAGGRLKLRLRAAPQSPPSWAGGCYIVCIKATDARQVASRSLFFLAVFALILARHVLVAIHWAVYRDGNTRRRRIFREVAMGSDELLAKLHAKGVHALTVS